MTDENSYHLERARQCRDMAKRSPDGVVRRLHEELATLHAQKAATQREVSAD
jgi:hypothetical protein